MKHNWFCSCFASILFRNRVKPGISVVPPFTRHIRRRDPRNYSVSKLCVADAFPTLHLSKNYNFRPTSFFQRPHVPRPSLLVTLRPKYAATSRRRSRKIMSIEIIGRRRRKKSENIV